MRELVLTKDGSHTIAIPEKRITYHSVHGAIQESVHVFIEAGLKHVAERLKNIAVFEMGFGTGLNAFLTAIEATKNNFTVSYTAVEWCPLTAEEASALNYPEWLGNPALFRQLHKSGWGEIAGINPFFSLQKIQLPLAEFSSSQLFDVIYYDAFAPSAQPELWTAETFAKLYAMLRDGGVLVTYCSKSQVRRAMQATGFKVEKIPGPRGKREMLRAKKV